MTPWLFPILLALTAGVSVVIQQSVNAGLKLELGSAAWAGFASYLLGTVLMALLAVVLRDPIPAGGVMARIPWWMWTGGLFGSIFIGLSIYLVPQLGAATFIALLITGQMLASVTLDHFGVLGLQQRPIDLSRVAGVAMLIGGVLLIRR
ncbi:MAG: DMT family transporter [Rhizobiaceae bacterium]